MLRELHISGLGVIDDLDLELHPGLNVLTGETGTGKTMVTIGLQLALGRRGGSSLVREGAPAAKVQARFDAPPSAVSAGWAEDDEVLLARTVTAEGRSTARVGGQLAPVSALTELAGELVEVHGQHDGQRLMSTVAQTRFLDRFAGGEHLDTVEALGAEHEGLREARGKLADLDERERDRERQMDLLAYQVREIESAAPRPGETHRLKLEAARLDHADRLLQRASAAERGLAGEEGAADALAAVSAELRAAGEVDPAAGELAERAFELSAAATELAVEVRTYRERLELDPARLDQVRERIAALDALQRKYGTGEEEVLAFLARAAESLDVLAGVEQARERAALEVSERVERVTA
ncbi:MAG TPA: AAA family ATPase, partial [Actinomycetota bacterium]|nr:AAA family ATPase [Actinomycetota bacterium]